MLATMNTRQRPARRRSGPDRSPSGPREAADPGTTRYGHTSGSGSNEPKRNERKDERGFEPRQGGDQTRPGSGTGKSEEDG
jgi:hypothetical protein